MVYDTTEITEKPVRYRGGQPDYPEPVRRDRVQGTVVLTAIVEPEGNVNRSTITVVRGVDPHLDRAAVDVIARSTFWPGCRDRVAVRVQLVIPISYWLGGIQEPPN